MFVVIAKSNAGTIYVYGPFPTHSAAVIFADWQLAGYDTTITRMINPD